MRYLELRIPLGIRPRPHNYQVVSVPLPHDSVFLHGRLPGCDTLLQSSRRDRRHSCREGEVRLDILILFLAPRFVSEAFRSSKRSAQFTLNQRKIKRPLPHLKGGSRTTPGTRMQREDLAVHLSSSGTAKTGTRPSLGPVGDLPGCLLR